jgi:hypothetical protein
MDTTLKFGIEIETINCTRPVLAQAVATAIPGALLDGARVTGPDGRSWQVVADGSLSGAANGEIVSPILTYADLPTLQAVVRAVRAAGARVDQSCGIHVHVDGARFDARTLGNLVKLVHKQERLIEMSLGIQERRLGQYCRPVDAAFLTTLVNRRPATLDALRAAWYGRDHEHASRYHHSRYRGINLNSFFFRGTVEFRLFEGSLHAGEIKSYVQFALALAEKALRIRNAPAARRAYNLENPKYAMRTFLLGLGLIGDEFKTARFHLLKRLPGNAAWWGDGRSRGRVCQDAPAPADAGPAAPAAATEPAQPTA